MKLKIAILFIVLISSFTQTANASNAKLELLQIYNTKFRNYYQQGLFKQALPFVEKSYSLAQEVLDDKEQIALIINDLATTKQMLGHLNEALTLFKKAYSLLKDLDESNQSTLLVMNNLVGIYRMLARLKEALTILEKIYPLTKTKLGEKHPQTIATLNNLATIYQELGRWDDALPLSKKAYSLSKEVLGETHIFTITCLNNLGYVHLKLSNLEQALFLLEKAYSLMNENLNQPHTLVGMLSNLGELYKELGRLDQALAFFEKHYNLTKQIVGEKHHLTILSINNLAIIYEDLGRFTEASALFEKSYSLAQQVSDQNHPLIIHQLINLAGIYSKLGRFKKALPLIEKAYKLSIQILGNKHPTTLTNGNNLAEIYRRLNRLNDALALSEKNYRLTKQLVGEKHPHTIRNLNTLAIINADLNRIYKSMDLYTKAYRLAPEVFGENHPVTLSTYLSLANVYLKLGLTNTSTRLFKKFIKGVENLRNINVSTENRQSLFKQMVPGYFSLSRIYITRTNQPFEAFRIAEMSKSRTLLESLTATLAVQKTDISSIEQKQLQNYKYRLAALNNKIAQALQNNRLEQRISLETEKNLLFNKYEKYHNSLMNKYSKYAKLNKVQIIGAKQGAKYLPANAVLISYLVENNRVLAFTLQADGTLTTHHLGKIPNLEKKLKNYRHRLSHQRTRGRVIDLRAEPKKHTISRELGKYLLEPLKNIIKNKQHWIISPHGALSLLPFETLRWQGDQSPIIAKHQISYVQSLSVLKLLQQRDKTYKTILNRGNLLAMGAPIYKPYSKWKNLPGALAELNQLEQIFKYTQSRIYKQKDATETKLQYLNQQAILTKYRYLLFSAHGDLNLQVPALSSIVLGQINNPQGIDGYVTASEWPSYDLKSDLTVLSACETGLGEFVNGEGIMGLPYAFYVAGNKNTILTLWSISDEVTTEFITSFFKKLKAGQKQVEALTATKREFLAKTGEAYWAAFILYGL
jgi:CHAT domain-containing protein/Flp pilus assembly protein TadD